MEILGFKKANCKNCYKCIRECPVKAIEFKEHQAQIIKSECLLCGRCVIVCPQNAKQSRNDVGKVKEMLKNGDRVVATIAPSFVSAFGEISVGTFEKALQKLGIAKVYETAEGAFLVKSKYEEILKNERPKVLISSCCHSIVKLIEQKYQDLLPYLAHVKTPMQVSNNIIHENDKNAKVVFIGPCISKKEEAELDDNVDVVLTFEELIEWMDEENVTFSGSENDGKNYRSRFFPIVGGIIKSMDKIPEYKYYSVDGIEQCMEVLDEITAGTVENYFIEMSACNGGCVQGPSIRKLLKSTILARENVKNYAHKVDDFNCDNIENIHKNFKAVEYKFNIPGEATIKQILEKTGKYTEQDELNCGACGYSTCREKAIAVYQGKAEVEMCLPYMKERAESMSGKIIAATPNAIIATDNQLFIQEINVSAYNMFNLDKSKSYRGEYISALMDPAQYVEIVEEHKNIECEKLQLSRYNKWVEQSVTYDNEHKILIIILKDITEDEEIREQNLSNQVRTVELADSVIKKQMRVAQEIASLLGETTAETKIALSSLKETLY